MKKFLITVLVIAILGAGGYWVYATYFANREPAEAKFKTETLARGQLTAQIGATGVVRSNQTAYLAWKTSGEIAKIAPVVGTDVKKGNTLAELSKASLQQNIILAEADLISAKKALEDLRTSNVAQARAQLALAEADLALEAAKDKREGKDYARASDLTIEQAQTKVALAEEDVKKYKDQYANVVNFDQSNIARLTVYQALLDSEKRLDQAEAQLAYMKGGPDQIDITKADADVVMAQANYDAALREWERLKDGPDKNDLAAAQTRIDAIQATLDSARIIAPFNGTITQLEAKVGDLVAPGTVAFRLDDLSKYLVDIQVSEVDVSQVKVGQTATLAFDAILGKEYTAVITEVGQVGTPSTGVVNFTITAELQKPDESIKPGMTAAANIVVNQLDNILLIPNRAVRMKDGEQVVYVLRGVTPTPVPVSLGAQSDNFSELLSGDLKEGDLIVLNPPTVMNPQNSPFSR